MPISISYRLNDRLGISINLRDALLIIFCWL
jgi:hypothetical protein